MEKTVKSLIDKICRKEGLGQIQLQNKSDQHRDFFAALHRLASQKTLHLDPFPADIDAAAHLTDEEWKEWMTKFDTLPK